MIISWTNCTKFPPSDSNVLGVGLIFYFGFSSVGLPEDFLHRLEKVGLVGGIYCTIIKGILLCWLNSEASFSVMTSTRACCRSNRLFKATICNAGVAVDLTCMKYIKDYSFYTFIGFYRNMPALLEDNFLILERKVSFGLVPVSIRRTNLQKSFTGVEFNSLLPFQIEWYYILLSTVCTVEYTWNISQEKKTQAFRFSVHGNIWELKILTNILRCRKRMAKGTENHKMSYVPHIWYFELNILWYGVQGWRLCRRRWITNAVTHTNKWVLCCVVLCVCVCVF